jgi:hypothetical protein
VNILKAIIVGFLSTAVAAACSTKSSSSGSNSNWLATCTSSADCSGSLECWCGACTKPCSAASECASFSASASCDTSVAAALCGVPTIQAACALGCAQNSDCSSLGAEGQCIDGACRRVTGRALSDAGAETCAALNGAIQKGYGDALAAAAAAAPCAYDADCVEAPAPRCGGATCGGVHTSNAGVAIVQAKLPELEHAVCDPYFAAGCSQPLGFIGCPYLGPPLCIHGTCTTCSLGFCSTLTPDAGAGAPVTCQDRTKQISDNIQANSALTDDSCANDLDCTTAAIDMRCYHSCESAPLSRAAADAVGSSLSTLQDNLCPAFEAAGCTSPVPPCPAPMPVKCVANKCVFAQ